MDRLQQLRQLQREGHLPLAGRTTRPAAAVAPATGPSPAVSSGADAAGSGAASTPQGQAGCSEDSAQAAFRPEQLGVPALEPAPTPAGTAYRWRVVAAAGCLYGRHSVAAWHHWLTEPAPAGAGGPALAWGPPAPDLAVQDAGGSRIAAPRNEAGGREAQGTGNTVGSHLPSQPEEETGAACPFPLAVLSQVAGPAGCRQQPPNRLEDLLFLDLETTGLSSAAGHRPFLAGLARFQVSADGTPHLVCELLVLTDLKEEPAFLAALADRIAQRPWLVTFNGRHFDWPLLESRWRLHRQPLPRLRAHWDLLYPARRLWAADGQPCHLRALEQRWLGHRRQGDVVGADIPRLFTRYLEGGHLQELVPVLRHNLWDLLGLAGLTAFTAAYLLRPPALAGSAQEALRIGREWERVDAAGAAAWYQRALSLADSRGSVLEAVRRLLHLYRRRGCWAEVAALQAALCDAHHPLAPVHPWLEQARLWLRLGDPARALRYLEGAERLTSRRRLGTAVGLASPSPWATVLTDLRRRVEARLSQQRAIP